MNAQLARRLTDLKKSKEEFEVFGKTVYLIDWELDNKKVIINIKDVNVGGADSIFPITLGIKEAEEMLLEPEQREKNVIAKKLTDSAIGIQDNSGKTPSNDNYNLDYLRKKLIDQIEGIEGGTLEVSRAKAVSTHVQTIVNMTKLELEYRKLNANSLEPTTNMFLEG